MMLTYATQLLISTVICHLAYSSNRQPGCDVISIENAVTANGQKLEGRYQRSGPTCSERGVYERNYNKQSYYMYFVAKLRPRDFQGWVVTIDRCHQAKNGYFVVEDASFYPYTASGIWKEYDGPNRALSDNPNVSIKCEVVAMEPDTSNNTKNKKNILQQHPMYSASIIAAVLALIAFVVALFSRRYQTQTTMSPRRDYEVRRRRATRIYSRIYRYFHHRPSRWLPESPRVSDSIHLGDPELYPFTRIHNRDQSGTSNASTSNDGATRADVEPDLKPRDPKPSASSGYLLVADTQTSAQDQSNDNANLNGTGENTDESRERCSLQSVCYSSDGTPESTHGTVSLSSPSSNDKKLAVHAMETAGMSQGEGISSDTTLTFM